MGMQKCFRNIIVTNLYIITFFIFLSSLLSLYFIQRIDIRLISSNYVLYGSIGSPIFWTEAHDLKCDLLYYLITVIIVATVWQLHLSHFREIIGVDCDSFNPIYSFIAAAIFNEIFVKRLLKNR